MPRSCGHLALEPCWQFLGAASPCCFGGMGEVATPSNRPTPAPDRKTWCMPPLGQLPPAQQTTATAWLAVLRLYLVAASIVVVDHVQEESRTMTTAVIDAGGHMRWPQWFRRWRCRRTVHSSLLVAGMLLRNRLNAPRTWIDETAWTRCWDGRPPCPT
jgi:hypothetical protein